jgi:hypothetical protein
VSIPTHALSLTEPWATLIIAGAKRVETRDWSTPFRGVFAVHAAKKFDPSVCWDEPFDSVLRKHFGRASYADGFRLGAIIGTAELLHCEPTTELAPHQSEQELAFGDYYPGRFGFCLDYAERLREPIPVRGMLNFWRIPEEVREQIARQMGGTANGS